MAHLAIYRQIHHETPRNHVSKNHLLTNTAPCSLVSPMLLCWVVFLSLQIAPTNKPSILPLCTSKTNLPSMNSFTTATYPRWQRSYGCAWWRKTTLGGELLWKSHRHKLPRGYVARKSSFQAIDKSEYSVTFCSLFNTTDLTHLCRKAYADLSLASWHPFFCPGFPEFMAKIHHRTLKMVCRLACKYSRQVNTVFLLHITFLWNQCEFLITVSKASRADISIFTFAYHSLGFGHNSSGRSKSDGVRRKWCLQLTLARGLLDGLLLKNCIHGSLHNHIAPKCFKCT